MLFHEHPTCRRKEFWGSLRLFSSPKTNLEKLFRQVELARELWTEALFPSAATRNCSHPLTLASIFVAGYHAPNEPQTTESLAGFWWFFYAPTEILLFSKGQLMARVRLCEVCKQQIEEERAEGSPDTRLCKEHAIAIDKYGGEYKMHATQERTSKAGSLKLNYGGITTVKTRNEEGIRKLRDEYLNRK